MEAWRSGAKVETTPGLKPGTEVLQTKLKTKPAAGARPQNAAFLPAPGTHPQLAHSRGLRPLPPTPRKRQQLGNHKLKYYRISNVKSCARRCQRFLNGNIYEKPSRGALLPPRRHQNDPKVTLRSSSRTQRGAQGAPSAPEEGQVARSIINMQAN